MRFITILIFTIGHVCGYAQDIRCEEDYVLNKYYFEKYEIIECNCMCTLQENTFYIHNKKNSSNIVVNGVSKIVFKNNETDKSIKDNPTINYFLSNKEYCEPLNIENDYRLNFFTLLPRSDKYCYEHSGYIDKKGDVCLLKDYVSKQLTKTIKPSRQYLYDDASENYQTKMYLIKGDEVEILKEEDGWLYVLYKGSREIRKWIPKSAVE